MKRIFLIAGSVLAVLVVAILALPLFIPASLIEEQIEKNASASLGREVTVDGAPKISVLPTRLTVSKLVVANAEGYDAPYLAAVEEADIGVKLFPLLGGNVEITHFLLKEPDIRLEASADGGNWQLGPAPSDDSATTNNAGGGGTIVRDVRLGDVRLTGGNVTYTTPEGEVWTASDADLQLTLDSLADPFGIEGTMNIQGEPARIKASFDTPRRYADTGSADMSLAMTVGDNSADMTLALTNQLTFGGDLDIDFPALRSLFALVGADLGTQNGFNRLRLKGPVSGSTERLAFGEGTELQFDDISGSGTVTIDVSKAQPKITGDVTLGALDLTPYLPPEPADFEALKSGEKSTFPAWSTEPMDFSALTAVDTDLHVKTGTLTMPSLQIGESDLTLKSTSGDMTVTVIETALYGGTGTATVRANVAGTPQFTIDADLKGVDVGDVAREVAGIRRLAGKGDITLTDVTARGRSQADLVNSLKGDIEVDLDQGALEGVNLGKIGRAALKTYDQITGEGGGLNAATLLASLDGVINEAKGPSQETDFSDMFLDAGMRNGVVSTKTLSMSGPYFRISGKAEVNLPAQTMAISLTPSVEAEGSDVLRSLPVPLSVAGSFNAPKIGIDMQSVIDGAVKNKARDVLGGAGIKLGEGQTLEESLQNTARDELQRRLLGTKDEETDGDATDGDVSTEKRPEDVLIEQGLGAIFGSGSKKDDKDGGQ